MSWIEQNALKRVFNVFKRFKEMKGKLWDNDIESLQTLSTAIENNSKHYVNDNKLFAKLLAMQLRQEVNYFGNIKEAIANLGRGLSTPLDYHIENLRLELNNSDDMAYFKSLGLEFERDNRESRAKKIELLQDNQREVIDKVEKFHKYDKVEKSFYNTANDFLKDTDNYK
jgi:hypothetical protein